MKHTGIYTYVSEINTNQQFHGQGVLTYPSGNKLATDNNSKWVNNKYVSQQNNKKLCNELNKISDHKIIDLRLVSDADTFYTLLSEYIKENENCVIYAHSPLPKPNEEHAQTFTEAIKSMNGHKIFVVCRDKKLVSILNELYSLAPANKYTAVENNQSAVVIYDENNEQYLLGIDSNGAPIPPITNSQSSIENKQSADDNNQGYIPLKSKYQGPTLVNGQPYFQPPQVLPNGTVTHYNGKNKTVHGEVNQGIFFNLRQHDKNIYASSGPRTIVTDDKQFHFPIYTQISLDQLKNFNINTVVNLHDYGDVQNSNNLKEVKHSNTILQYQIAGNKLLTAAGIQLIIHPITDFGCSPQLVDIAQQVIELVQQGKTVLIHCALGQGRTGTVLALIDILKNTFVPRLEDYINKSNTYVQEHVTNTHPHYIAETTIVNDNSILNTIFTKVHEAARQNAQDIYDHINEFNANSLQKHFVLEKHTIEKRSYVYARYGVENQQQLQLIFDTIIKDDEEILDGIDEYTDLNQNVGNTVTNPIISQAEKNPLVKNKGKMKLQFTPPKD